MIDLTGQKFNRLTVLKYNSITKKWLCQCDCGKRKEINGANLRNGLTQSCGCLQKEKTTSKIIGKKFGELTVLKDSGLRDSKRRILWECQCSCGKITNVRTDNLISGNTYSCGCKKTSHGEQKIEQLLIENHIPYKKEFVFKDLKSSKNGYLRFDFAILDDKNNLQYLIEYDGETHDLAYIQGWNTKEKILYQLECDNLKNEYCLKNNIPLIRISYKQKNINIKNLTL